MRVEVAASAPQDVHTCTVGVHLSAEGSELVSSEGPHSAPPRVAPNSGADRMWASVLRSLMKSVSLSVGRSR